MLLLAASAAAPQPIREPSACEIAARPELLMAQKGRRLSVTGYYERDMHYNIIRPDGCGDAPLFVSFTGEAVGRIQAFMREAYPGRNFGGGWVWGTFSGEVKVRRYRAPYTMDEVEAAYLEVDTIVFDPVRRMIFGN